MSVSTEMLGMTDCGLTAVSSMVDAEKSACEKTGDEEARRMVLQNLAILIQPSQKVAICGRTGR